MQEDSSSRRHSVRPSAASLATVILALAVAAPCLAVSPVRIGTREHIDHVELEVHEASGNLFALTRFEIPATSQHGWEVHISTDGGASWTRTLLRTSSERPEFLSATVVGDHMYFVTEETGPASGLVDIRRVHAATGATDADFGVYPVVNVGSGNLKDLVLFGNTDASDSSVYLAVIADDGDLRLFYALTALFDIDDATPSDWNEYRAGSGGTGVTDADWRLDAAFNAGGSSPYGIFLSYFDYSGNLCVWRMSQTAHNVVVLSSDASSNDHVRIAADRDTVLVVYTRSDSGFVDIRYHRSADAGATWGWAYLAIDSGDQSYAAPTISGRWHRGMMVAYHRMGTGGDALMSTRRPVEENRWTTAEVTEGIGLRTGTRTDIQTLAAGGWGVLFVSDTGASQAAYFMPLPLIFADGFASGNVDLWSTVSGAL